MAIRFLTLTLTIALSACGSSSPTQPAASSSPTPTPTPAPAPAPSPIAPGVTNWSITQRFVSVDGPDNCWIRYQRGWLTGAIFPNLETVITRADGAIRVESTWFTVNYSGSYNGTSFSASGVKPLEGGGRLCDGTSYLQLPGVSNLTGQFADDEQSLMATEVNTYRLTTGEQVTYTWAWSGTRRN